MKFSAILAKAAALAAIASMAIGCTADSITQYYTSVPGGGWASRANNVHFYFLDEDGNSLIDVDDPATYPVPCTSNDEKPDIPDVQDGYYYSHGEDGAYFSSRIAKDGNGDVFFSTYFPVDQSTYHYSFYVYFDDTFAEFDLTYGYTDDGVGGNGWVSHILSLKVNGTNVYSDQESGTGLYPSVYIRKASGSAIAWGE